MSFVLLYATDSGAILKGDRRMSNSNKDITFEGFLKVIQINKNLAVGCTGGVEFMLKNLYDTYMKNKEVGITEFSRLFRESIVNNVRNSNIKHKGGSYLMAGIEDGFLRINVVLCNEKVYEDSLVERPIGSKPILLASGTCGGDNPTEFANKVFSEAEGTLDERLNTIIYKAADVSPYVNKKIDTVSIGVLNE